MNLLIIGAGGHGRVVKEVAEAMNRFRFIDFVDDNCPNAVGKITDLEKLSEKYEAAFVGVGNNAQRSELLKKLLSLGYVIPKMIHPTAYVSISAKIGKGVIVEPRAIINANAEIGDGCIISVGAIVDHDAKIGKVSHINAGAICKAGSIVEDYAKVDAGEVVKGY